jgi:SAM-dependent methyltransferase
VALGAELLELGPGPGVTTEVLRRRVARLTAVELDAALAARLARRLPRPGVRVVRGDGAALPFRDRSFEAAAVFTMLHHVPSVALQDRLLAEVCRCLRPGGLLVGSDSTFGSTTWPTRWWWWTRTASRAGWRRPASRSRWWTRAGRIRFRARRPQAQTPR